MTTTPPTTISIANDLDDWRGGKPIVDPFGEGDLDDWKGGQPLELLEGTTLTTEPPSTTAAPTTTLTTEAPTTQSPTTEAPTTESPTTIAPTTVSPTTIEPTTLAPTTLEPTTEAPTTLSCTTVYPSTMPPYTYISITDPVETTAAPATPPPATPPPSTASPTTLASTTLAPTTVESTTLAPSTIPPTTELPCLCNDDFTGNNGDPPNGYKWTLVGSPDIQNNTVEVTNNGSFAEKVISRCIFGSSFEVQVDFDIQSPDANSFNCQLFIEVDSTHQVYLSAARYGSSRYFQVGLINGGSWSYYAGVRTNNTGSLKIIRNGTTVSFYAKDGASSWAQVISSKTLDSSDAICYLSCGSWDGYPTITCRFDNFIVNSGCPDSIPPTTLAPTTEAPTTLAPTTLAPTTLAPTTESLTTLAPTTAAPTTLAPTTLGGTTSAPTTLAPTTVVSSTEAPTTSPSVTYETDFSEYATGSPPSDWTERGNSFTSIDIAANADADAIGDNELVLVNPNNTRTLLSWDDCDGIEDPDILTKFSVGTGSSTSYSIYIKARGSGAAGSENCYMVVVGAQYGVSIAKFVAGSATFISNASSSMATIYNTGTYFVRFRVSGTSLKCKLWNANAVEPEEWLLETTDSDISSGGWIGVGGYSSETIYVDYFAVGDGQYVSFPPTGWAWSDKEKYFSDVSPSPIYYTTLINSIRGMGGQFGSADKEVVGAAIYVGSTHSSQVRVAIYSGGSLSAGPVGATLLVDLGQTTGSGTNELITLSCSPVAVPKNAPLWLLIKGNDSGFRIVYQDTNDIGQAGDWQPTRGRWGTTSIDYNEANAWAATYPADAGGAFGTNLLTGFRIILQDASGTTAAPTTLAPTTLAPTTLEPTTLAPTTPEPTTLASTTESPTTSAPTTLAPTTTTPTTQAPTTVAPTTIYPSTLAPTTLTPTTEAPTTSGPTTLAPTTIASTTASPTTLAPTTLVPTTVESTTLAPTTEVSSTPVPTTIPPTTQVPTSLVPTTLAPTTIAPTTLLVTTISPTTLLPTTVGPTTLIGSTVPPTTSAPLLICYREMRSLIITEYELRSLINTEIELDGNICW